MDRKRIFFVLLMCVVLSVAARAQTSHWQYDMYAYQYDMTVYFTLDGVVVLNNYEVAAFVNDECRGVGKVVTSETDGGQTVTFGYLRIRSNSASGETVTFKCYDKTWNQELELEELSEPFPFTANSVTGLPSTPFVLTLTGRGDVNGDNSVDSGDVMAVYHVMADTNASDDMKMRADVNGDNEVNSGDVMAIYSIMAKKQKQ